MRTLRILPLFALVPLSYVACVSDDPVSAGFPAADAGGPSSSSSSSGSTSSSGGSDAAIDAPSGKLDGVVVDAAGVPVTGAVVRVEGSATTATTGPDGKFSLDAAAPYDLVVVYPTTLTASGKAGIAVIGATTRQPRVQVDIGASRKAGSTTITTSGIAAGNFPLPATEGLSFVFAPTSRALSVTKTFTSGSSATTVYSAGSALAWSGDTPFTGEIHGLRYSVDSARLPTAFSGYGHTSYNIGENGTDTLTVGLNTVTNGRVTGTIDPNGSTPATLSYALRVSGTSSLFLSVVYTADTFDLPLINVAGARLAVAATGRGPNGGTASAWKTGLAIGASGVALKIPAELNATVPVDAAIDVASDAQFSWEAAAAGFSTYEVAIACGVGALVPDYTMIVLTKKTSVVVPDQSKIGNPFPGGKSCIWSSSAMTSPDTDDLLGVGGWTRYTGMRLSPGDGAFSTTKVRTFTSK